MSFTKITAASLLSLTVMAAPGFAATASLIGDEITIEQFFPTLADPFSVPTVVTVDETDTDIRDFGASGVFAHADATTLNFIIPSTTRFATSFSSEADAGNFVSFQDLDFDDGSTITGISLTSTFGGITLSLIHI